MIFIHIHKGHQLKLIYWLFNSINSQEMRVDIFIQFVFGKDIIYGISNDL